MGESLAGYLYAGLLYLIWGFWWLFISAWFCIAGEKDVKTSCRKYSSVQAPIHSQSWIPQPFLSHIPIEPILKLLLAFSGVLVESFLDIVDDENGHKRLITFVYQLHHNEQGQMTDVAKFQHIILYGTIALSGFMDLITLYLKLPPHTSQFFFSLAFWVEGILLFFRSSCRPELGMYVYYIWAFLAFATACFSLMRMWQAYHTLINLCLSCCIILQGSWLVQAGFLIYPPGGNRVIEMGESPFEIRASMVEFNNTLHRQNGFEYESSHHTIPMFISALFCLNLISSAIAVLLMWVAVHLFVRKSIRFQRFEYTGLPLQHRSDCEEDSSRINGKASKKTTN